MAQWHNSKKGGIPMSKAPRQRRRSAKQSREEKQEQGTRVYELAEQHDLTTEALITLLKDLGVRVKNEMTSLDPGYSRINRI